MSRRKTIRVPVTGLCGDRRVVRGWSVVADDKFGRSLVRRRWCFLGRGGYVLRGVGPRGCCKPSLLHREVFAHYHGVLPVGHEVDHIDRDKTNNHPDNLRAVTRGVNNANGKMRTDNRSGYRGVVKIGPGKWVARVQVKGRTIELGRFASPRDAGDAVNDAYAKFYPGVSVPNPRRGK